MFIEQGIKSGNQFGKYLLGSLLVFIASQIGSFPLLVGVLIKAFKNGDAIPSSTDDVVKFFDPNLSLFLLLLMFVFAIGALFLVVKYLHKQTFKTIITSRQKIDWSRVFFAFGLWAVISIITTLITYFQGEGELIWNFQPVRFAILAVIAVALIPIQTSTEELVFRGYLMQGFGNGTFQKKFVMGIFYTILYVPIYFASEFLFGRKFISNVNLSPLNDIIQFCIPFLILFLIDLILTKLKFFETDFYTKMYQNSKNKLLPLVVTSMIFGLMHITNPEVSKLGYTIMIYYIGTGFFLGILTLMDEGLELSIGFHAANNLLGALLVTSDWSVFQTYAVFKDVSEPTAGFETVFMPVFVLFPILLFIFSKKYKWTNWKEKLTGKIQINSNLNSVAND